MKKITLLIIWAICMPIFAFAQNNTEEKFNLIFEDNFDYVGKPDSQYWDYTPRRSPDWAKYLVTDNSETVEVKDGYLYLRAIKNPDRVADNVPFLTGGIKTEGKVGITYGKVEVRAKVPEGKGSFPAVWMMPLKATYGGWPNSGEIDIMEHLNYDNIIYQTIHTHYTWDLGHSSNPKSSNTTGYNKNDFNVYGLEWYPDRLDFFVNGIKTYTYPRVFPEIETQWPFDHEFYLILNTACDGSWGGPVNENDLPFEMMIDWVKMYELNTDVVFYDVPGYQGKSYGSEDMKDTYIESIQSTGLLNDIDYQIDNKPEDYYIFHDEILEVESGNEFALNLKAKSLGEYSESIVRQDLRFTAAYAYVDYDGDTVFETSLDRIGDVSPKHNVGGNYDVLDVTFNFDALEVQESQEGRIRIVYHNAWSNHGGPNANVQEGVVHDFKLKIIPKDLSSTKQNSFNPSVTRIDNKIIIKGIDSDYIVRVFDFTGRILSNMSFSAGAQSNIEIPSNQLVIVKVQTIDGKEFRTKL